MKPSVFIHRMEQRNAREMIQKEGRKRQTQVEKIEEMPKVANLMKRNDEGEAQG